MANKQREFDIIDITKAFSLLTSTDTLKRFLHILDADNFEQAELRWVTDTAIECFNDNRRAPTFDVLESRLRNNKKLKKEEKEILADFISELQTAKPKKQSIPEFERILESFVQTAYIDKAVSEISDLVKDGDLDSVGELLRELKMPEMTVLDVLFAPRDIHMLWAVDNAEPFPTGLRKLDSVMNGGLRAGELGVYMAPTGYGKSMLLVHTATAGWRKGRNVVHFTFENSPEETLRRYLSNLGGESAEVIREQGADGKVATRIKLLEDNVGSEIAIIRRVGVGTTINDLYNDLVALEEVHDFVTDMLVVDYGDLMSPTRTGKDNYESMKMVFEELHDLAVDTNLPLWTATQSNRESLKAKRTKLDHISDSLGKAMNADIVIGFSRPEKDSVEDGVDIDGDMAELKVLKFRRGVEGDIVHVQTDFEKARVIETDVDEEDVDERSKRLEEKRKKRQEATKKQSERKSRGS